MTTFIRFRSTSGGEPLPVIMVSLVDDLTQLVTPSLPALVDTGADGTLVPFDILQAAGFHPNRQRRRFFTAQVEQPPEIVVGYSVMLRINEHELNEVDVYGSRTIDEVILGRNVLNRMVFTYHGPKHLFELLEVEAFD